MRFIAEPTVAFSRVSATWQLVRARRDGDRLTASAVTLPGLLHRLVIDAKWQLYLLDVFIVPRHRSEDCEKLAV